MDYKYAIAYVLIIAIMGGITNNLIAKKRLNKRSNSNTPDSGAVPSPINGGKRLIFPPIIDSIALRIQVVLLLVAAITYELNKWASHAASLSLLLSYTVIFLVISNIATMLGTALYHIHLRDK